MPNARPTDPSLLSGLLPPADRGGEGAPCIGAATLDARRVEAFNALLLQLCPRARPLAAGQIAAAARRLLYTAAREGGAASIARRLARLDELERMRADGGFALEAVHGERIEQLLRYVEQQDDLIPDDVPVVGQLDDALLIDLLVRELGPVLSDYADYRAWRDAQAQRTGQPPGARGLSWHSWLEARRREIESGRQRLRTTYATPGLPGGFRVA